MRQFETQVKLNVLLLGYCDVLIGMDWLEKHQVILNYFQNMFTCLNNQGERITITGILRKISARKFSSLQMKKVVRNGYKVFVVHILNNEQINKENKWGFEDIPIL